MPKPTPKPPPTPPPPAARGGRALTQLGEGAPDAPALVTGDASGFPGGVSREGGGERRGEGEALPAAPPPPPPPPPPKPTTPARLAGWSCEWPESAEEADIFEARVTLSAAVEASGEVSAVEVLDDPGHGLGPAAARCARAARFTPARDAGGAPVGARLRFRVRFTR
ncbi:MAG: hypothetical protein FJ138_14240 [Deltaproteobacteria bacterium]|nr:hypothetical protein [Deltaproteobacteria bacterium]